LADNRTFHGLLLGKILAPSMVPCNLVKKLKEEIDRYMSVPFTYLNKTE
jgi:hypothetical protein